MTPPENPDKTLSLKRAGLLFGSQEVISRAAAIGLSLFAARTLGPGEVGRLGLAVIISALVSMVASCAESAAVFLDRSHGTNAPAKEASRLRLLLTATLVTPVLVWAEPLVELFGAHRDDALVGLVRLMLLVPCMEALATGPRVRAQRALDLSYLGRVQMGSVFAYVALAFGAVAGGLGVVGMVGAQLIATGGTTAFLWGSTRRRWTEHASGTPKAVGSALRRGAWRLFVGGFGGFLGLRLDSLLVARSLGATGLGLYSMAWSASRLCTMVASRASEQTLGPLLPQIGVQSERAMQVLKRTYVYFILVAGVSSCALMVWTPPLLPRLLGEKWLPAITAVQLTSVSTLCVPAVTMVGLMLNTSGRAHKIALGTAAHLAGLAVLVPPLATAFGVAGAALGEFGAVIALTAVLLGVLTKSGLSTDWIDRRATLWSLAGLAPSAIGTVLVVPGTAWGAEVLLSTACTASFFLIVVQYAPFREILERVLKRR